MHSYDARRPVDSSPCRCVSQLQQERGGVTADQQSTDALGEKILELKARINRLEWERLPRSW